MKICPSILLLFSLYLGGQGVAYGDDSCSVSLTASNKMLYSQKEITWPEACPKLTITLKNVGTIPKNAMGHNLVIAPVAKMEAVANQAVSVGSAKNFVPESADVLGSTRLLGPNESATLVLEKATLNGASELAFFCTFPGHWLRMQGRLIVSGGKS